MTLLQKIIKFMAYTLACMLCCLIVGSLTFGIYFIFSRKSRFSIQENTTSVSVSSEVVNDSNIDLSVDKETLMNFQETYQNVESLFISNSIGELYIRVGSTFDVTASDVSEDFSCTIENGTLTIINEYKINNIFNNLNSKPLIILTIPEDFVCDKAVITNGAGTIYVDALSTRILRIECGAGKSEFNNIFADSARIEGGVGASYFTDCSLTNANIECGVGSMEYNGILSGICQISNGVGKLDFLLTGDFDDYDIDATTGIGSIRINGTSYTSSTHINVGAENKLSIKGGIGNITLTVTN